MLAVDPLAYLELADSIETVEPAPGPTPATSVPRGLSGGAGWPSVPRPDHELAGGLGTATLSRKGELVRFALKVAVLAGVLLLLVLGFNLAGERAIERAVSHAAG